jgi:hypothetical protein
LAISSFPDDFQTAPRATHNWLTRRHTLSQSCKIRLFAAVTAVNMKLGSDREISSCPSRIFLGEWAPRISVIADANPVTLHLRHLWTQHSRYTVHFIREVIFTSLSMSSMFQSRWKDMDPYQIKPRISVVSVRCEADDGPFKFQQRVTSVDPDSALTIYNSTSELHFADTCPCNRGANHDRPTTAVR